MKKITHLKKAVLLMVLFTACFISNVSAQYKKGDITANAGLSFGLIGYGYGFYGSSSGFLPVTINGEYSLDEKFSVGPYAGIYTRSYNYGSNYKDRFTALSFGVRGTFHATPFLNEMLSFGLDEEKFDIYGTVLLGIETYSWKFDEQYNGSNFYSNGSRVIFGPVLGVRYQFNPKMGIFFEGGRGAFGYGTLGISAKL